MFCHSISPYPANLLDPVKVIVSRPECEVYYKLPRFIGCLWLLLKDVYKPLKK